MVIGRFFLRLMSLFKNAAKNSPYRLIHDSRYRRSFKQRLYKRLGYNYDQWIRTAQVEDWFESLNKLDPAKLDALEVSPGARKVWRDFGFRTYESVQFPDFDICENTTGKTYDLVLADHVLEHVKRPHRAVRNIFKMLKPSGVFFVTTPFMIMMHGNDDYYRWTKNGMRVLLEDAGFLPDAIEIESWGNRGSVIANFDDWKIHGWYKNMRNEENLPVVIWAKAQKR